MKQEVTELTINGVTYVPKGTETQKPNGNRAVVVVDRGWIFAGDVTEKDGKIYLSRAVHVFSWPSSCGGFSGMVANPKGADLRPVADVQIPADGEIFRVPVSDNWGLK